MASSGSESTVSDYLAAALGCPVTSSKRSRICVACICEPGSEDCRNVKSDRIERAFKNLRSQGPGLQFHFKLPGGGFSATPYIHEIEVGRREYRDASAVQLICKDDLGHVVMTLEATDKQAMMFGEALIRGCQDKQNLHPLSIPL